MLLPKKTKYRKQFKGRNNGAATSGTELAFGQFGLRSDGTDRVTSRQIEAARRAMTRYIRRGGKIWIRVFPDIPVTKKPAEVGMGSGKGAIDHYAVRIKPGHILFEMEGVAEDTAKEAMRLAAMKLPVKTKFIVRHIPGEVTE